MRRVDLREGDSEGGIELDVIVHEVGHHATEDGLLELGCGIFAKLSVALVEK